MIFFKLQTIEKKYIFVGKKKDRVYVKRFTTYLLISFKCAAVDVTH